MIHQGVPEGFVELHGDLRQFSQTEEDAAEDDGMTDDLGDDMDDMGMDDFEI